MSDKKIVLVISTAHQFNEYIKELISQCDDEEWQFNHKNNLLIIGEKEYKLITRREQLRGFHGVEVIFHDPLGKVEIDTELENLVKIARLP